MTDSSASTPSASATSSVLIEEHLAQPRQHLIDRNDSPEHEDDSNSSSSTSPHLLQGSLNQLIDAAGFGRWQLRLMLMCGVCWSADAMESMLLSFLLPAIAQERAWAPLPPGADGLLGAVVFVGIFIGAYVWGLASDRWGRRLGYLATAAFTALFGLFSSWSPSFAALAIFRLLVGIGLGGAAVAYTLFSETLPSDARAKALLLNQSFWTIGALLEVLLAWVVLPRGGWRALLFWSAVPLLGVLLLWRVLPESPRFLATRGRYSQAEHLIQQVHSANRTGRTVRLVLSPLSSSTNNPSLSVRDQLATLFSPSLRRTTFLVFIIWFVDSAAYYGFSFVTPRLVDDPSPSSPSVDSSPDDASVHGLRLPDQVFVSMLVSTLAEFPGILLPAFLLDRCGRRISLLLCFSLASLAGLLLSLSSSSSSPTALLFLGRGAMSGAFVSTYVYTTEVYPTSIRTTGMGAASSMSRLAGICTSFVAEDVAPRPACAVFAGIAAIGALAAWALPIETAWRGLQEHTGSTALEMSRVPKREPSSSSPSSPSLPQATGRYRHLQSEQSVDDLDEDEHDEIEIDLHHHSS